MSTETTPTRRYEFKTLGFVMSFNAPANGADINRIVGREGAVEESYFTLYAYQDRNKVFRQKFAEALEAETGVKRLTEEKPSKKEGEPAKIVFAETEDEYYNRLTLPAGEGLPAAITEAQATVIANRVNDEIGDWSFTASNRQRVAQAYYDKADQLLAKIGAGQGTVEESTKKIETYLGVVFSSYFGEWNRDNVARAMKEINDKAVRDAENSLG